MKLPEPDRVAGIVILAMVFLFAAAIVLTMQDAVATLTR